MKSQNLLNGVTVVLQGVQSINVLAIAAASVAAAVHLNDPFGPEVKAGAMQSPAVIQEQVYAAGPDGMESGLSVVLEHANLFA